MQTLNLENIGKRFLQIRTGNGLSQIQFAERIRLKQSAISAIENGDRLPTTENLISVISEFGQSADWWLFGAENKEMRIAEPAAEYTATMPVLALAGAGNPCCIDQLEPIGQIVVQKGYDGPNIQVVKIRGTSYYGCRGKETKGQCLKTSMVEQSIIDDRVIINMLGTLSKPAELKAAWSASKQTGNGPDRIQQLTREISTLETKKQRLTVAISEGVIEFADAKQQMTTLKTNLTRLQQERSELLRANIDEPEWDTLAGINGIFHQATQEEQREIIHLVVKQIRVFPTYLTIEYNFPRSNDGACTARVHLPTK